MIQLLTVSNRGYLNLLVNFYNTLKVAAPHRLSQLVIITYDQELIKLVPPDIVGCVRYVSYPSLIIKDETSKQAGYTLEGRPVVSDAIPFGKGYWNLITRYKLLAIWKLLQEPNVDAVFYCDPDIAFVRDPFEGLTSGAEFQIQRGNPYCSGVMYISNSNAAAKQLFNPLAWSDSKLNDEEYLTQQIQAQKVPTHVLDFDTFPNGLIWDDEAKVQRLIETKRCVLFHFNFIKTAERKLEKMKELKLFFP